MMGTLAGFVEKIDRAALCKIVPEDLVKSLEEQMSSMVDTHVSDDDLLKDCISDLEASNLFLALYQNAKNIFFAQTGLNLGIGCHPEEDNTYDETGGVFWYVDHEALYVKSQAFEQLEHRFGSVVRRSFYTVWG